MNNNLKLKKTLKELLIFMKVLKGCRYIKIPTRLKDRYDQIIKDVEMVLELY